GILRREWSGDESRAGRDAGRQAIQPEDAPVVLVEVPGDQIPAAVPGDQGVRLGASGRSILFAVVETEGLPVVDRAAHRFEHARVDTAAFLCVDEADAVDAVPQARRHHLPDRGQGTRGGFIYLDARGRNAL